MKYYTSVLFVDSKGLVLLQQKTNDAPRWPGMWCMFGGSIEEGETALMAAVREVQEELEITLPPEAYTLVGAYTFPDMHITNFTAPIPVDAAFPLREGRGMGYFTLAEIEHLNIFENDKEVIRAYFNGVS